MSDPVEEDDRLVELHTDIGREGAIVEVRPEEHENPWEGDMSYVTPNEARKLRDQLDDFLAGVSDAE